MSPRVSVAAGPQVVAIPGPSVVPPRVLEAMSRPMPDIYDGELLPVTDEIYDRLPGLARTTSSGFITISNGHGAWEMAFANTLSRGDRVLVLDNGVFARVWAEMATFDGLDVETLVADPGRAIEPAALAERLRADPERTIKAVLAVHVDTATSIRNDIATIRAELDAADHPALLMADCIASLGVERFEMDAWGVDVTIAASQKGLMTPPGLGFVWAAPKARQAAATAGLRTKYWDWESRARPGAHWQRFCGTQPVAHLFGFREALRIIEDEGMEQRWARHRVLADAVRAAVEAWSAPEGLRLHARVPAERGDGVTTIETGAFDPERLRSLVRERCGLTLGTGLDALAGRSFRIGHMGYVNAPIVMGVLGTIEAALGALDVPTSGSGTAAAVQVLASALAA